MKDPGKGQVFGLFLSVARLENVNGTGIFYGILDIHRRIQRNREVLNE